LISGSRKIHEIARVVFKQTPTLKSMMGMISFFSQPLCGADLGLFAHV
jgi:hypothetical protein